MEPISILFVGFEVVVRRGTARCRRKAGFHGRRRCRVGNCRANTVSNRLGGVGGPPTGGGTPPLSARLPPMAGRLKPQKPRICDGLAQHHRGYQLRLPEGICEMVE